MTQDQAPESSSGGGGGGGSGLSAGAIAGMAAAGALLVALIAVIATYVHRRKAQSVMQLVGPLDAKTPQVRAQCATCTRLLHRLCRAARLSARSRTRCVQ